MKQIKLNQRGEFHPLVLVCIVAVLGLLVTGFLSINYYNKFTEQRDKNQPIIDAAVEQAKNEQKTALENDFLEREKQPYRNYTSPSQFGSVKLVFPKTWSGYSVERPASMEFTAHPNVVPSDNVNYALRMSVINRSYANEIKRYDSRIRSGRIRSSATTVAGVNGVRYDGEINSGQNASMVIFPLRDKTLSVWTETQDFRRDFDNIVLKNLTFVP